MIRVYRVWAVGGLLLVMLVVALVLPRLTRRARPHLLLVSIDTLRADRIGVYGHSARTSPFIDSVARRGTVFDEVVVPLPATDPSHAALLTALHPVKTGLLANSMQLRPDLETVAEVLRAEGYATAGATGVYHLSSRYGFDQGFDRFTSVRVESDHRRLAPEVTADVLESIRKYQAGPPDRPLFLFVHYFDVHFPYINHERPEASPDDVSKAALSEAYDSGVRFVDGHIRQVWQALEDAGLASNTVIAITSDHGEQLGEHGLNFGHADLYGETIRVPLVMAGPGVPVHRVTELVSSMDIAPTLLELAGARFAGETDGRSLVPLMNGVAPDPAPARPLLVIAYPTYARSLALRVGPLFYVWNFDWLYRHLTVGHIPKVPASPAHDSHQAEVSIDGERRLFTIPAIDIRPHRITADIEATPGCPVKLTVTLPSAVVFARDVAIEGPTRIQYAVARLDSSFLSVTPGSCVGWVKWFVERMPTELGASVDGAKALDTYLFETMYTLRKYTVEDELFDVAADPTMVTNLIRTHPRELIDGFRTKIELAFSSYGNETKVPLRLSTKEIERLRSLGYVR
jgi:Sulfatase